MSMAECARQNAGIASGFAVRRASDSEKPLARIQSAPIATTLIGDKPIQT